MEVLDICDPQKNFWDVYPSLIFPEEFNAIYKADKSKTKEESSRILWGIYVCFHPKSNYKNLSDNQREELTIKEIIKDPKFKFSKYNKAVILFESMVLTPARRFLRDWEKMVRDRKEFMDSIDYSIDTYQMKEAMLKNNKAVYDDYNKVLESLEKEGDKSIVKGKGEESASEKDMI